MQRFFKAKDQPDAVVPDLGKLTFNLLEKAPALPITIRQVNDLPENIKQRLYRGLVPSFILGQLGINPITWTDPYDEKRIQLNALPGTARVSITASPTSDPKDTFLNLELDDNSLNGIDVKLMVLNDPRSPKFGTDFDEKGQPTQFGTLRRNIREEERAKQAGMAPGQNRSTLGASRFVFAQLDSFLSMLGHRAYWIEPLTYSSAWVFEHRGLAYVTGHKLMDEIHEEFQKDHPLAHALDSNTPFRLPEQANSIRGRAWAIHDGILSVIGTRWEKVRMIRVIGLHASVLTAPNVPF